MNKISYEERAVVYRAALDTWGKEAQLMMVIEEMSELTKALCKLRRAKPEEQAKRLQDVAEETADVTIMLEQLRMIFDMNQDVCDEMDRKIERLALKLDMALPHDDAGKPILLEKCGLSDRAYLALKRAGFFTLQEVVDRIHWRSQLFSINGVGTILANEIIKKAHDWGLVFAWEHEEPPMEYKPGPGEHEERAT